MGEKFFVDELMSVTGQFRGSSFKGDFSYTYFVQ